MTPRRTHSALHAGSCAYALRLLLTRTLAQRSVSGRLYARLMPFERPRLWAIFWARSSPLELVTIGTSPRRVRPGHTRAGLSTPRDPRPIAANPAGDGRAST